MLLLAATTLAVAGPGVAPAAGAVAAAAGRKRPNIVFVLADDLDMAELRYMPRTRQLLGAHGATFDDYFVSNSLCCPSRTTTLRGQYAHNTGVWSNGGSNGGFERALRQGIEQDTVATRLSGSGYRRRRSASTSTAIRTGLARLRAPWVGQLGEPGRTAPRTASTTTC